ncbi:MAG: hypothetical protein IT267_03100 [Saprospiraceae bacterium]|nr:hypothetical protein [Saprospiraceae bacterium]
MWYLFLCILFTVSLGFIFKILHRKTTNLYNVILVNYIICALIGITRIDYQIVLKNTTIHYYGLTNGILFLIGFNVFAISISKTGLGITTLLQKLSVFATIIAGVIMGEHMSLIQIVALIVAGAALYYIFSENTSFTTLYNTHKIFLFLCLFIAASIEILFLKFSKHYSDSTFFTALTALVFIYSAFWGMVFWIVSKHKKITNKDLLFGSALGIPNYFSIEFLNLALNDGIDGIILFPILNLSVILLSGIIGNKLFDEKYSKRQQIGYALALISILTISLCQLLTT